MSEMEFKPSSPEAFKLLMDGSRCFADMERNGMRIDEGYLDQAIVWAGKEIRKIENELRESDVFRIWRKRFGRKADLGSDDQFSKVLTQDLELSWEEKTTSGRPSMDVHTLEKIDHPFVKQVLGLRKLKKAKSTYLTGLKRETVDGLLHPFFNLHLATSFRSSSDSPNLQNQPVRDKRQAKLIRRAFIPRTHEYVIGEIDYGALEFRGAACKWEDEKMVQYASDPSLDIHRDMGAECFDCKTDEVSKEARYHGKNGFVFPILYGSYYGSCAKNLWNTAQSTELKLKDGTLVRDHLRARGIEELGSKKGELASNTFMHHMKGVENRFHKRFPTWSEKRDEWWELYLKRGWFEIPSGFVCKGIFTYNNLMNTPIQGSCFHLLLWSLIEMNKWLKKHKMKTKLICQIHDSMILDIFRAELQDVLCKAKEIMTENIRDHWKWILTPLEIEVEVAEKNWYGKKSWSEGAGEWMPAA